MVSSGLGGHPAPTWRSRVPRRSPGGHFGPRGGSFWRLRGWFVDSSGAHFRSTVAAEQPASKRAHMPNMQTFANIAFHLFLHQATCCHRKLSPWRSWGGLRLRKCPLHYLLIITQLPPMDHLGRRDTRSAYNFIQLSTNFPELSPKCTSNSTPY